MNDPRRPSEGGRGNSETMTTKSAGKYLGERQVGQRRYDSFDFRCRWCKHRSIVLAPLQNDVDFWECPGCKRNYTHWHPEIDRPGEPGLYPVIDDYERPGRPLSS